MKEPEREFFSIMMSFRKLNISSMLPDINHSDYATLRCLSHNRSSNKENMVRISELVKEMQVPPPAISRKLKSLEDRKYIERIVDKDDRRNTYVKITDRGQTTLEEADEIMNGFSESIVGKMGEEGMKRLNDCLKELLATAKKEIKERKFKGKKEIEEND